METNVCVMFLTNKKLVIYSSPSQDAPAQWERCERRHEHSPMHKQSDMGHEEGLKSLEKLVGNRNRLSERAWRL